MNYDINYRSGDLLSTNNTVIGNPEDCMSWTVGNGTVRVGTVAASSSSFTKKVNLTSPTVTNSSGKWAQVCVSDPTSYYGNQGPVQIVV
jgi:hypothetical protein